MENNYAATEKDLVKFVLDNAPEGLRKSDRERFEASVMGSSDFSYYHSMEWRRTLSNNRDADATLYWDFRNVNYEPIEDSEGNFWKEYAVETKVSWPSYGGYDPETSRERIKLMSDICEFAEAIQQRFSGPVFQLVQTKAERDAADARREQQRIKNLADSIVTDSAKEAMKGARVGSERIIRTERLSNLPHGRYEVTVGNKKYTLIHTGDVYANVMRTA